LRYLKQAPCIRGGRIEAKRIFKGGRRIAEYCSLGGDRVFLLVAIGLADLQCLPGLFDPAQVALADAVPAAVEPNPSSSPNDLSTMIEISGTSFEAGAAVQLDAPSLDGEIGVSSTSLEATVPWVPARQARADAVFAVAGPFPEYRKAQGRKCSE
jgi:hypothetical protein